LLVVCGSLTIAAAVLLVLGVAFESHAFKEAAAICFVVMALVSFLPLIGSCCYFGWQKLRNIVKH
jgi:uncharacterized membrane protein YjjP (DUF1212 family)